MEKVYISTHYENLNRLLNEIVPTEVFEGAYKNKNNKRFWTGAFGPEKGIEIGSAVYDHPGIYWETWCYCDPENVPEILAFYQKEQAKSQSGIGEIVIES